MGSSNTSIIDYQILMHYLRSQCVCAWSDNTHKGNANVNMQSMWKEF